MKLAMKKYTLQYQLVSPHQHRRNTAEHAIQTFKNHFLAVLSSTNPNFPINQWDGLLPQAVITLNLLRNPRINPCLSAHAYINGVYDFNATPIAHPGTLLLAHEKPNQRPSWAVHGIEAWYVGPSLDHYRCISAYVPSTQQLRVCDTVQYFPHTILFPITTDMDSLK